MATKFIYECSNPECGALWQTDPKGHCPKCIKPNGGGSSTSVRAVISVEEWREAHPQT